ncbi:MAG: VOC family protein [Hyphomicrobium sp.]|uniref:VOC family protein n=1 Tax=Hyphomicrobium sp. TaxID=82 RepID=UPI0013294FC2|nr:VOC family protein [Hyphomicrobium sp.]KAB2943968.1 MAG: glyoxalase/bleomycin resistance/extradiol dioxygenase family protein [Hyphomicrobium sp.]MBZ0208878.1 VOC family protein [Hyphomicrobium sp.]
MKPNAILETVLYARDLGAIEDFYRQALGLEPFAKVEGRHVFYRVEEQMLLVFNPVATTKPFPHDAKLPVPPHGADGEGHVCFRASADEIAAWRARLEEQGVVIEADFEWPDGGRSIYFRDPAGNCLEFAEPRIWGLK